MLQSFSAKLESLSLEQVAQTIVDTLGQVLKVDIAILLSYEPKQYFVYQQSQGKGEKGQLVEQAILAETVPTIEEIVVINKIEKNQPNYQAYRQADIRSTLSLPLICQQEVIAVISLHHCREAHTWQEEEVRLAAMMATQAARAIAQLRAYEQVRALAQREGMLNLITSAIRSSLEPEAIFAAITKELGEALQVDGCTLSLWTKADQFMERVGFYNPHETSNQEKPSTYRNTSIVPIAENPILQKLIATRKPVVVEDLQQQPKLARYDLPLHSLAKALLIVPLIVEGEIIGSITLKQTRHSRHWSQSELELAEAVAAQAAIAVQQAKLYETTRKQAEQLRESEQKVKQLNTYLTESVLKRFLPEAIVNQAAAGELELDLSPEPHCVTILFCDLVGFTRLSHCLEASCLATLLNEYLEAMSKAVFEQRGTVDKFIGDGIMALFGAPEDLSPREQAQRAIATARAMHRYLEDLNRTWCAKDIFADNPLPTLQMRCGIHQGKAVVGMFGGGQRKDYTAIGSAVNIAARLQEIALPNSILVSDTIAACLGAKEKLKPVTPLKLRGIKEDVVAYSLPLYWGARIRT